MQHTLLERFFGEVVGLKLLELSCGAFARMIRGLAPAAAEKIEAPSHVP
jgi:hypothetical protein